MESGPTFVLIFVGLFVLAIGQAFVHRMRNPYAPIEYKELPVSFRHEIERVLLGYEHRDARWTRNGDEAHAEGQYQGNRVRIQGKFDAMRELVEFEVDNVRSSRTQQIAAVEELPQAALAEIDRVLGDAAVAFQRTIVKAGANAGESHYEVRGRAQNWKWEIAVTAGGQLIEMECEKRRDRRETARSARQGRSGDEPRSEPTR